MVRADHWYTLNDRDRGFSARYFQRRSFGQAWRGCNDSNVLSVHVRCHDLIQYSDRKNEGTRSLMPSGKSEVNLGGSRLAWLLTVFEDKIHRQEGKNSPTRRKESPRRVVEVRGEGLQVMDSWVRLGGAAVPHECGNGELLFCSEFPPNACLPPTYPIAGVEINGDRNHPLLTPNSR